MSGPRGTESPDDHLRRRYLHEQAAIAAIAAELGVAVSTVHRRLNRAGIPRRGKPGATPAPPLSRTWLANRLDSGMTPTAIATQLRVDHSTVLWAMAKHGLLRLDGDAARQATRAAAMYKRHASLRAIATELRIDRRRVTMMLLAVDTAIRHPGQPRVDVDRSSDGSPYRHRI